MPSEIAISTHIFVYEMLTPQHLKSIRERNFPSVELWVASPHVNYRSPGSLMEVAGTVREAGLSICSIHAPFYRSVSDAALGRFLSLSAVERTERREAVQETLQVLTQMPFPTTDLLVVHPGSPENFGGPEGIERLQSSLEELLISASERRVRIALENMPFPGAGCKEVLSTLERIGSPYLGLAFDIGHANVLGTSAALVRQCLARAWVIHAHDNNGDGDSHLLPLDGSVDWAALAADLLLVGSRAPFVLELKCKDEHASFMREARDRVLKLFQEAG